MEFHESIIAIAAGVGLSAAAGLRVFVPLFIASLAIQFGYLEVNESFAWLGHWTATVALGTAALLEVGVYYIPWLDNVLDTIATPAAIIAGTATTAAVLPELGPALEWVIAILVGGGSAGVVQGASVLARGTSTAGSGGLGNPVVSTGELGGSVGISLLAVFLPILALIIVAILLFFVLRLFFRLFRRKRTAAGAEV